MKKQLINLSRALNQQSTDKLMKKHTQIYLKEMGYDPSDFIPSEISGQKAVDIHHIDCRGMGGSETQDYIENLIALTRQEHDALGDKKDLIEMLYVKHLTVMRQRGVKINMERIHEKYRENIDKIFGLEYAENKNNELLLGLSIKK